MDSVLDASNQESMARLQWGLTSERNSSMDIDQLSSLQTSYASSTSPEHNEDEDEQDETDAVPVRTQTAVDDEVDGGGSRADCELDLTDYGQIFNIGGSGETVMEQLDFQVNLRNEHAHFQLADRLMRAVQLLHCQHVQNRLKQQQRRHRSSHHSENIFVTSSSSPPTPKKLSESSDSQTGKGCGRTSRAERLAHDQAREVAHLAVSIGAEQLWQEYSLPTLRRVSSKCSSTTNTSVAAETIVSHLPSSEQQHHQSEAVIKAAVGSACQPISIPVGGAPQLGSDLSLPSYVATSSPPTIRRADLLEQQQNLCPGCQGPLASMAAAAGAPSANGSSGGRRSSSSNLTANLRLCRYYGLYFCSSCHCNTLMVVPARVLESWDFSMLPVSRPARDLLGLVHGVPLFSVSAGHFQAVSCTRLVSVERLRTQAGQAASFVVACGRDTGLLKAVDQLPGHWLSSRIHGQRLYSMADLRLVESGEMERQLTAFVGASCRHVLSCDLCRARGFLCGICLSNPATKEADRLLFPFEGPRVVQCQHCRGCVHRKCLEQLSRQPPIAGVSDNPPTWSVWCPQCRRIRQRKMRLQQHQVDQLASAVGALDLADGAPLETSSAPE